MNMSQSSVDHDALKKKILLEELLVSLKAKDLSMISDVNEFMEILEDQKCSRTKCMEELESLGASWSDDVYFRAVESFEDRGWREKFVKMTHDRQLKWMKRLAAMEKINNSLEEIQESLKGLPPTLDGNKFLEVLEEKKYSRANCMALLEILGTSSFSSDVYFRAVESFEDRGWREKFVNMSQSRQWEWMRVLAAKDVEDSCWAWLGIGRR